MSEKKERKQVALVRKYQKIFNSGDGKKVLYDLIRRANVLCTSFAGMDHATMAYNEGRRSLILYILSQIDSDPEAITELMAKSLEDNNVFN